MRLRTVGAVVAAAIVATVLLRPGRDTWPIHNGHPRDGVVVCFGDSLTAGHGAAPEDGYPAVLARLVGREVVNRGRDGDTSVAALARLDEVLALEPAIVVVMLGGNDMLRRLPIADTRAALATIFDRLLAAGAMVAFLGIDPPFASGARMAAVRDLCRERGVLWVGDVMDGLWGDPARMSDQIHPNAAGYRVIAERVAAALRDRIGPRSAPP